MIYLSRVFITLIICILVYNTVLVITEKGIRIETHLIKPVEVHEVAPCAEEEN